MALLAACTSLGPLSLNIYLPSVPAVQVYFGATVAQVQATVSFSLVAFGLGLVLLGPLTDRYGRRPCLLGGLAIFVAGSVIAAMSESLQLLIAARVLQSVGCAFAFIGARAVVADISPPEDLARSVAQMTMIMLVVQMVAPLLGNVIMSFGGWRGIQLASGGIAAALLLFVLLTQSETMPSAVRSTTRAFFLGYLKPSISLLQRPGFLPLVLQGGLLYSAYPAFVSIAPHLMVEALGRPETEFAYYFAFLPLGYFAGNAFVLKFGRRLGHDALVLTGAVVAIAACLISAALFFAGIAHPLSLFLPAGALLNVGLGLALPTVSARAITLSTPSIGSGWGLVGCAQQVFAALSVQTMGLFATNSPFPVLALSAGAMLLVCGLETWRRSQAADTSI